MKADKAFLFLVHRDHGLLLLYTTRKKSKGPHYQVPGGHVEQDDFDAASKIKQKSAEKDYLLAYKIGAARELYEETGIDLRDSLDRLQPAKLRLPKDETSCDYKGRIFFSAEIFDGDVALQHNRNRGVLISSLTQALDKIPPNIMLKLSEEHQGFRFERNLSQAIESLTLHSGGKVSAALSMIKDGDVTRLMDALHDEGNTKGEQEMIQSPIECSKVIKHEIGRSPCKERNPNDCHRIFNLYFPQIICENGDDLEQIGTLPLIFAVHCYGCDSQVVMQSFNNYANSHNAVIVAPEGLQRSFNGLDCCGYALSSKVDDVGYFSEIQTVLEDEYSFLKAEYSYGVGWSNGGFMVMYAAKLFRAIAPISGYIIDYQDMRDGTSVFFHHSLDDPFVRSSGCCSNPDTPACCCGIFADECISVQDVMKNIAQEKNGCDYEVGGVQLEQSFEDTDKGISCLTATGKSCIANNTICLYDHSGHFNSGGFEKSFPMAEQIVDFFAADACRINNGVWSDQNKSCSCQDTRFVGVFCLEPANSHLFTSKPDPSVTELLSKEPNHVFTGGLLILTLIGLFTLRNQLNRRRLNDKQSHESAEEKLELVASTRKLGRRSGTLG